MSDNPNEPLSDVEAQALRSLAREPVPSPELEERLVAELKRRGSIRTGGGWIMWISRTAAAALIAGMAFLGGLTMGKRGDTAAQSSADSGPAGTAVAANQYMLLMYMRVDPAAAATATRPARDVEARTSPAYRAIIDEYRQWALDRAEEGRLVGAEKLADDTRVMTGRGEEMRIAESAHSDRVLGGYFLVTAPSLDDAIALAKSHPHLKYGGEVEVRPIERTD